MQKIEQKKDWTLTPRAFHKLLRWLGAEADSSGQSYLEMRQRLVAYFDRKNCVAPDELADETLNRVARRLEEETRLVSETPARYCYIVARYVFMEYWRGTRRNEVPLDGVQRQSEQNDARQSESKDESVIREKLMSCLDQCIERLEPLNHELIIRYYYGERGDKIENRRTLAAELGVTVNALSIRACRIRDKLEACVDSCLRGH